MTSTSLPSGHQTSRAPSWAHQLPWVDSLAALTAGIIVLLLHEFLAAFYGLQRNLVLFIGAANAAYSLGGLAVGLTRNRAALVALIAANLLWAAMCAALSIRFASDASPFGIAHLVLEGAFVFTLASLEWRHRRAILDLPRSRR